MVSYAIEVRCGTCPDKVKVEHFDRPPTQDDLRMVAAGWLLFNLGDGRLRGQCPDCVAAAPEAKNRRAGFTLVELLVVLLIVSIVAVVALPVVMTTWRGQRVSNAAQAIQGVMTVVGADAQKINGITGVRFLPAANRITRITDPTSPAFGQVDPAAPLAWDRMVPLAQPPGYTEGRIAIYTGASDYPTAGGFTPIPGVLCVEQELWTPYTDPVTKQVHMTLNNPTAWDWNVRLGDKIELGGHLYTVCGPMHKGPADGNVERLVNYDPAWRAAADRGDGPREFLYLVNGVDDDGDGYIDNGFDGVDNDLNGVIDDAAEWSEAERWLEGIKAGVRQGTYTLRRRPAPAPAASVVSLAGALIDATTWGESDPADRVRSNLVVDPWTGEAELIVDAWGRTTAARSVGVPTADGMKAPYWHLWISDVEAVEYPPIVAGDARLLTIDARTGRTSTIDADPADPAAAFAEARRGGR